jgi:hypothetical protein
VLAERYEDVQLTKEQCLGRKVRHNCCVIGAEAETGMANLAETVTSAPPVKELSALHAAGGDEAVGGPPPGRMIQRLKMTRDWQCARVNRSPYNAASEFPPSHGACEKEATDQSEPMCQGRAEYSANPDHSQVGQWQKVFYVDINL